VTRAAEPLPFSEGEFADRLAVVQQRLRADALQGALLFDPENIFWLTGFQTIGYFTFNCLFVPAAGKPVLISRTVNRHLARETPTLQGFVAIDDDAVPTEVLAVHLAAAVPAGAPVGAETGAWYLTVRDHRDLQARVAVRLVDWNGFIEQQRLIKTPAQLERMRWAARAAEAGLDAALRAIAPGKTENDLAAAMFAATISAGSEYLGHPPLVVAGERTALCFAMWRRRVLRVGDVVLLEAAGCIDRYHAMIARSAVLGPASPAQRDAAATIILMLEAAIGAMRPGVRCSDVYAACRAVAEAAGLAGYFDHRAAYGIGLGFPPNWSEGKIISIRAGETAVLRPGMAFHVVPTLFMPEFGMCFSESVVVTESGCEVLNDYPRRLFEVA